VRASSKKGFSGLHVQKKLVKDDNGRCSVGCVGEECFSQSDSEMGVSGGIGANDRHASEMRKTDGRVIESLERGGEERGGERGYCEYEN
jgi:hypothetical protein